MCVCVCDHVLVCHVHVFGGVRHIYPVPCPTLLTTHPPACLPTLGTYIRYLLIWYYCVCVRHKLGLVWSGLV